ncbi:mediator of DNA damage checkpoint protein 1-like isoform X2 [Anneissia japonica]|uniref:mediator of DNA damage checkpoint protein 1-like isoform X2 n=1 Tax=Anneissia japonica TaxID=1529436 RepID=UPI001425522C|nr:mediator of DNA damage checkpoint protein 1-like isoform X2 [Anneissia japonica]
MDFDLTQAIPLSDVESDVTDDLDESLSKKPIGFIKTIKQKGYPETTFPIYEGVNLIGRGDAANVLIPLKALSKEHACIEADGESIFIYDKGSRNKTRRGKLFLKPNVRYELKDSDKLIFGDVKCEFLINHGQEQAKEDDMGIESNSGSETGSECMLQINVVLPSGSSSAVIDTKSKTANNNACIVSPDQKQPNKRTACETFVEESFLEDKEKKEIFAEDSGSDTDIEDGLQQTKQTDTKADKDLTNVDENETQIHDGSVNQHSTPASKDQEKDTKIEANIFADEPTQACTMDDISTLKYNTASDTDDEEVDKAALTTAPTQPYTAAEAATQRYGDGDETDEDVDAGVANAPTLAYTVAEAATQMYGEKSDSEDGNDASEALTAAPTLAYDNIDENTIKDQSCEDAKDGNSDGDKTDDEVDLAGLATAPTQAYTVAEAATQRYSDGDETDEEVDLAGLATAPTQAYTVAEAATQRYSDGDETDEEVDLAGLATAPTQAYTVAEAATQRYDDGVETDEDVDAEIAAAPTQAYTAAEAATQIYGEESDSEDAASGGLAAAPTLAYDNIDEKEAEESSEDVAAAPTLAYEAQTQNAETLDVQGSAVESQVQGKLEEKGSCSPQPLDDAPTQVFGVDDENAPIQVFGVDDETAATQAFGEDDETAATQAFGEDDETAATQAFGEDDETAATQAFGEDDETAATQAFGEDDETATTQAFGEDDETAATQAFGEDDETAASHVFGDDEQGPGPARNVVDSVKEQKPSAQLQPDELIETQSYGVENEPMDTADSNTLEIDVTGDTQVPDSQETDELEIESLLRKVPGKSVLVSPEKKSKNQEKKKVVFSSVPEFEPQKKSHDLKEGKKNTKGKKQKGIKDKKEGDDKEVLDASRRSGRSRKQTTRMKDSVDQKKRRSMSSNAEIAFSISKDENNVGIGEQPIKDVCGEKSPSQSGENKVLAVEEQSNGQSMTARKRRQVEEGMKEKESDVINTTQNTVTQTPRGRSNRTKNMKSSLKEDKVNKVNGEEQMEEKQTRGRRSKINILEEEKEECTKPVEDAFEIEKTIKNTVPQIPRGRSNKTRNMKNSLKEDMVYKTGGEEQLEEKQTRGRRSKRNIVEEEKEESTETVKDAFETDNTLRSTVAETPRGRRHKANNMKTSVTEDRVVKTDRDEQMEEKQTRGRGSKRKVVEEGKQESTQSLKDAFETDNTLQSTVTETPRGKSNKTKNIRNSRMKEDMVDTTDRCKQVEEKQTRGRGSKRKLVEEEKEKTTEPRSRVSKRGKAENSEEIDSQKITKNKSSTICQSPTPSKKAKKAQDEDLPCSPSLRKRGNDSKPKIMFTGVVDEGWVKIVKSLGGELVTSIHDCTHLITDKIRRTVKFLCGLAKGAYLIDPKWLEESKKRKSFVNPDNFLVTDRASEKQHGFSLKRSHDMAIETRLFEDYKIHVTASVKPDTNQMKDIIHCAGGEFLSKMPNKYEEKIVVVSSEDDETRCNSALKAGIPIVSSEFILTGILRQEIHIEPYRLFVEVPSSASKSKPSASAKKGTTSKRRR